MIFKHFKRSIEPRILSKRTLRTWQTELTKMYPDTLQMQNSVVPRYTEPKMLPKHLTNRTTPNLPNLKKVFLIKMYNNASGANWFCCHLEFSRPKCIVVGLVTNYSGAAAAVDLVAVCRSSIKPG